MKTDNRNHRLNLSIYFAFERWLTYVHRSALPVGDYVTHTYAVYLGPFGIQFSWDTYKVEPSAGSAP